jgi:hypothetical protein
MLGCPVRLEHVDESLVLEGHRLRLSLVLMSVLFSLAHDEPGTLFIGATDHGESVEVYLTPEKALSEPKFDAEIELARKWIAYEFGNLRWEAYGPLSRVVLVIPKRQGHQEYEHFKSIAS